MLVDKGITGALFAIIATLMAFKIITRVQEKTGNNDNLVSGLKKEIASIKDEINLLSKKAESKNLTSLDSSDKCITH